jgi:ABC-type glycerol-3-phosphate transport system permease component
MIIIQNITESSLNKFLGRKSMRKLVGDILCYILLISIGIAMLLPFLWMISSSLKSRGDVFIFPPQWIPKPIRWHNYVEAMTTVPFSRFIKNSIQITILVIIGQVVSSSLVAFGFARLRFIGKNILFMILLSTMMIPYHVTLIPLFITFRKIGWINTFKPLIIPAYFGSPFFIFLLRQYIMTIPLAFDDAAKIDGCGYFQLFYKIIIPLIKPVLITISIFSFLWTWNDFMGPLIYINDMEKFTVTLGLNLFRYSYGTEWHLLMAASTIALLPCLVIFFIAQRYIIGGIVLSGLKQ